MKKYLFLILLLLAGSIAHAQYTVTGTVKNTSGTPLSSRVVFARADTTVNPKWFPTFYVTDSTDVNGVYTITMPSSVVNGMQIIVSTVNCNAVVVTKTYVYSGSNITSDFTTCITPDPVITGQVSMGNSSSRAPNAKLQLIEKQIDSIIGGTTYYKLTPIDSVIASSNGNFAFSYPANKAELLIRASFQSFSNHYSKYAPTYYNNVLSWPSATTLPKDSSSYPNIVMKQVLGGGGSGTVSGFVVVGAGKTTAVGDPVPNRLILLTTLTDSAVAFGLSDNAGTFHFGNIPYGTYKIYADVLGKTSQPLIFPVTAMTPNVGFITFDDKVRTINPRVISLGVANTAVQNISIYPNPAKEKLVINTVAADCRAAIYDMAGRRAMDNILLRAGFINEVNISTLPQGSYMLQITAPAGNEAHRFVKE